MTTIRDEYNRNIGQPSWYVASEAGGPQRGPEREHTHHVLDEHKLGNETYLQYEAFTSGASLLDNYKVDSNTGKLIILGGTATTHGKISKRICVTAQPPTI